MQATDLRRALRLARTSPFLSTVTVLLLAGGITLTTAAFGIVNVVWFRPLSFPTPTASWSSASCTRASGPRCRPRRQPTGRGVKPTGGKSLPPTLRRSTCS
jgi:hypothetical protein